MPLMNEIELMVELGIKSNRTIKKHRDSGMPYLRIGKLIKYELDVVMGWIKEQNDKSNN